MFGFIPKKTKLLKTTLGKFFNNGRYKSKISTELIYIPSKKLKELGMDIGDTVISKYEGNMLHNEVVYYTPLEEDNNVPFTRFVEEYTQVGISGPKPKLLGKELWVTLSNVVSSNYVGKTETTSTIIKKWDIHTFIKEFGIETLGNVDIYHQLDIIKIKKVLGFTLPSPMYFSSVTNINGVKVIPTPLIKKVDNIYQVLGITLA